MGCLTMIIFGITAFVAMYLFTVSKPIGIIAIVLLIAAYIYVLKRTAKKEAQRMAQYEEKGDIKDLPFKPDQQYISPNHKSGIYVDPENKQVGFLVATDPNSYNLEVRRHRFEDVWDSMLIVDGDTISHISRLDEITVPSETEEITNENEANNESPAENDADSEVLTIKLKVVVTEKYDIDYIIPFLNTSNAFTDSKPLTRESKEYKEAIEAAWKWHNLMQMIITDTLKPNTNETESPAGEE